MCFSLDPAIQETATVASVELCSLTENWSSATCGFLQEQGRQYQSRVATELVYS